MWCTPGIPAPTCSTQAGCGRSPATTRWCSSLSTAARSRGSRLPSTQKNLITRALGPDENTLCDAFEVSFTKGDKILLCTDGLVVTATDDEICRAVCAGKSAEESLDDLIALAKAQGAPDNVTAVLIEHE